MRSMEGPFVARRCVRSGTGYRWFEQAHAPGDYLDAAQLQRLSGSLPAGDVPAAPAELVRPDLATWPVLPTPMLLCDPLFGAPPDADAGAWEGACTALGAFLGRLHAVPAAEVSFLPGRRRAAWLPAASAVTHRVAAARTDLIRRSDGVLALAASAAGPPARPDCLVHGRFSSGLVVPLDRPVVMGWREAGVGDPDRDLAYFLAELIEAAAVGTGAARFPALVRCFLAGYRTVAGQPCLDRLPALVADRLLEHYAQGVVAVGSADHVEQVAAAATGRWRELADLLPKGDR
ncbi:phosphotransferase family protein [Micromonospora sp. NPDC049460]|uniref:phosphotransferase family protein n=1 Tax=unclassified Micromonospora TaxID=2617518 RepID=UPI00371AC4AC